MHLKSSSLPAVMQVGRTGGASIRAISTACKYSLMAMPALLLLKCLYQTCLKCSRNTAAQKLQHSLVQCCSTRAVHMPTAMLFVLQAQLMDVDGDVEHKRARDSMTNGLESSSDDHEQQEQVNQLAA